MRTVDYSLSRASLSAGGLAAVEILTTDQHQILNSTMWLDDSLISLGQNMLLKQHPQINGLQSTLLGQNFSFSPMPFEFVQILHEKGNHWITISTIGCPASTVNVYDSLHGTLSMHNQGVIADILQTQKEFIFFSIKMCSGKAIYMTVACSHLPSQHHFAMAGTHPQWFTNKRE